MEQNWISKWSVYFVRNRHRRVLHKLVQVMACIVVFCTTYALILPAITMEKKAFCGLEEHTHSEVCYQQTVQKKLICTSDVLGLHVHGAGCYDAEHRVVCGQADYVVHSHDASCFEGEGNLVCTLAEQSAHVHTDICYAAPEEVLHHHIENCYTNQKGDLICTSEEYAGHSHSADCYVTGEELECTLEEHHVHGNNCYTYPLVCTLSTDPHVHDESCYTSGDLQCSTPEGHIHGESCVESQHTCTSTEEGHTCGSECYTTVSVCSISENHSHSDSCYTSVLNCGKDDGQTHEHGDSCYSTEPELICSLTENHIHQDDCFKKVLACETPEDPGHSHTDECYLWETVTICGYEGGEPEQLPPVLICTEPAPQTHIHTDACFETTAVEPVPICGNSVDNHTHTSSCYTVICGQEEHTHSLSCYSDPEADVESRETWEATFSQVELSGDRYLDVIAIAESQLGYVESSRNYAVWEDNSIHGYTRYGAWYGVPYGDWCGMFVSFCLRYSGVDNIPINYGVRPWIEDLTELGLYHSAEEYTPKSGDIVFFDWEGDGLSDHVGLVAEVTEATEHMGATVKTIEGNSSNCVRYVSYRADDPVLLGYSILPEKKPLFITKTAVIYTDNTYAASAEDATVIALSGYIPENAEVRAYPVTPESDLEILCAYDISIFLPDGTLYQPADGEVVNVSIQSPVLETGGNDLIVYHIPEEGSPDPVATHVTAESVSFDATHFSTYAIALADSGELDIRVYYPDGTEVPYTAFDSWYSKYPVLGSYKFGQAIGWNSTLFTVEITYSEFSETSGHKIYKISDNSGWNSVHEVAVEQNKTTLSFQSDASTGQQYHYVIAATGSTAPVSGEAATADEFRTLMAGSKTSVSITLMDYITLTEPMPTEANVVIDLNGHTITCENTDALFIVNGGTLTIKDSQAGQGSGHTLTYSVMEATVTDSSIGTTGESNKSYTVSAFGGIIAGAGPLIQSNGGTINIESGMIHGGTGRAIEASGNSTVNLSGGCLYDFSGVDQGGAVYINGGSLNISDDAVVAGNHAGNYGGGIYAQNCTVTMDGGVISENTVSDTNSNNGYGSGAEQAKSGGAGIAAQSCTFHFSGGYITNNASLAGGYWGGGGGILCRDSTVLNMSGGYVTGNQANAGGGIKTIDYIDGSATVNISGGYICSNIATYGEGGGVSIGGGDKAYVTAGYINNNLTHSPEDWGGGGLFVADDASLYIERVVVTDNICGGFGAGIAGCSTARMHISITDGGAIYNNKARGQNVSSGGSTKSEDVAYAKNSPVFMSNGYQDIFSALNCTVEGAMLGDEVANWHGSCDGSPITSTSANDIINSEYILGLTAGADPSVRALSLARVYITGNVSNTHGGGILCNGYMVLGKPQEEIMYVGARIEVAARKQYLDQNKEPLEFPSDNPFTFVIEKEDGTVVTTGTVNENGKIIFSGRLPFTNDGTYTYFIRELPGNNPTILYDQTRYRLTVTTSLGQISNPASSVATYQCYIDSIAVDKWNPDTEFWDTYIEAYDPADSDKGAIDLDLGDSFFNYGGETVQETSLTVTKVWNCDNSFIPESITVTLMQNDVAYESAMASVQLNASNNWSHIWTELPVADSEGNVFSYTVQEESLSNFDAAYEVAVNPADRTIQANITNTLKTYSLDISKISNHKEPIALEGAAFCLKDPTGQPLSFVSDPETASYLPAGLSAENSTMVLLTNADGKILITGLPAGTYTLEETEAPVGFQLAESVQITLGGEAMETNRTHQMTVVDELVEYNLPETGGSGTYLYTTGGLLLIFVAVILLYSNTSKCRKEDLISS